MATKAFVEELKEKGFDLSKAIPFEKWAVVRCSQCEALVVNGVACHETGCPNNARARARWVEEGEEGEEVEEGS